MRISMADLGVELPVLAAPLAGGAGTPELVVAAARAGSLGFLSAGYKTPEAIAEQIATVRASTPTFGVNVFAPNPQPVDPDAFRAYAQALAPEAAPYGIDLADATPVEDDDEWDAKLELLLADPVPLVSFTFATPPAAVIAALRRAGTVVGQSVTSVGEAEHARDAGADLLVAQSPAAGGHWGTFTPDDPPETLALPDLVARVRAAVELPVIAAGGIGDAGDVAAALQAGAVAAMAGTLLLRTQESGASATHKASLGDPARDGTVLTRAFTGRPARALRSAFTDRYDAIAPAGYPAIHYLTTGLRRAAAAAGDAERVHLWAGTGYRHATEEDAATVLRRLAGG